MSISTPRRSRIATIGTLLLLTMAPAIYALDGPVPAGSLPGGATVSDDDTSGGEQWGRPGGRNLTFSDFDLPLFTLLNWGPVNATSVGIAFDGQIDVGTDEVLMYSTSSNLAGGEAIWTGQTKVELFDTPRRTEDVETQFILTVTDSSASPVPLSVDPVTGMPRVNVLTVPGQFTANLRMEAKLASTSFQPALDLFDSLDTDPVETQLAQTSFTHGFFFESADTLSILEHDATMQERTAAILEFLDFHNLEVDGKFDDVKDTLGRIEASISDLLMRLGDLPTQDYLESHLFSLEARIEESESRILESIENISVMGQSELKLQVVHSRVQGGGGRRFLVAATENGSFVNGDFNIFVVVALPDDPRDTPVFFFENDIDVTEVVTTFPVPGLVNVDVDLRGYLSSTATFLIIGTHEDEAKDHDQHQGTILTSVDPYR